MILELADICIHSGQQSEFEQAVQFGLDTVLSKAKGFKRYEVRHCIETPARYVLLILWDTLEDHTVGFRGSPAMTEWRGMVGRFFAKPPAVEHFEFVAASRT
jgi:heme-degrading monooxygenase HmoA